MAIQINPAAAPQLVPLPFQHEDEIPVGKKLDQAYDHPVAQAMINEDQEALRELEVQRRSKQERIRYVWTHFKSFKATCDNMKIGNPEERDIAFTAFTALMEKVKEDNQVSKQKPKKVKKEVTDRLSNRTRKATPAAPGTIQFRLEELKNELSKFELEINKVRKEYQATIGKTLNDDIQTKTRKEIDLLKNRYWTLLRTYQGDIVQKTADKTAEELEDEKALARLVAKGIITDPKQPVIKKKYHGLLGSFENKINHIQAKMLHAPYRAYTDKEAQDVASNLNALITPQDTKTALELKKQINEDREATLKQLTDRKVEVLTALNSARSALQLLIHSHTNKYVPIKSFNGWGSFCPEAEALQVPLEARPPVDKTTPSSKHVRVVVPKV